MTACAREHMLRIAKQRIGTQGYVNLLAQLRRGPHSTTEIAEACGVSRLRVLIVMRHCQRNGIVHRVDWHRTTPHSRLVPRWALGGDGDISMPMHEERTHRPRAAPSVLVLLTTVLQMLQERPMTRAEMAEELRMNIETPERLVTMLRRARLVYVAGWYAGPNGGRAAEFSACLAAPKADKPRPKPQQYDFAAWRARKKQARLQEAWSGRLAA